LGEGPNLRIMVTPRRSLLRPVNGDPEWDGAHSLQGRAWRYPV